MKTKENDEHEERVQEGDDNVRIKLGVKDYLALILALLETAAIPLLVVTLVLIIMVFLAFR